MIELTLYLCGHAKRLLHFSAYWTVIMVGAVLWTVLVGPKRSRIELRKLKRQNPPPRLFRQKRFVPHQIPSWKQWPRASIFPNS